MLRLGRKPQQKPTRPEGKNKTEMHELRNSVTLMCPPVVVNPSFCLPTNQDAIYCVGVQSVQGEILSESEVRRHVRRIQQKRDSRYSPAF